MNDLFQEIKNLTRDSFTEKLYLWCKSKGISDDEWRTVTLTASENVYKTYEIRQGREGKRRTIQEPIPELKKIQKTFIPLFEKIILHKACMSRKGYGIASNADMHANAKHLLRIDIKKCYPSISLTLIKETIRGKEFNIDISNFLTSTINFCTIYTQNGPHWKVLPTGSPTSPILCNIALTPLDVAIQAIADAKGYKYTRYIDDLILSTTNDKREWGIIDLITEEIDNIGLKVNRKKTRWSTRGSQDRMIVTGVSIGEGSRVPREFSRMLRAKLNNLAKDGLPIDQETHGCLSYVKQIDLAKYESFIVYFKQRQQRWI